MTQQDPPATEEISVPVLNLEDKPLDLDDLNISPEHSPLPTIVLNNDTPAPSDDFSPEDSPQPGPSEEEDAFTEPTAVQPPSPPAPSSPTPDSPIPEVRAIEELELHGPVIDFYRHKNILLTGATGFVGKTVLWKLIQSLGTSLGQIYVLIRNGSNKRSKIGRPTDRIRNEILSNKAFISLRRNMGPAKFDAIIKDKIVPIGGDIISPDLSITEEDREMIVKSVNVVIHCAAALDYQERLDLALETNTLGTLRLMDLADECEHMETFVHMSLAYLNANLPDGHVQERVYPMELGDPEILLTEIVGLELQDIPKMTQRILMHYPNTYTFTKSLTEHLILKRVDYNRVEEVQGGKTQWPVAIVRATQVGAGAYEPAPGWIDGVTGANGMVLLTGHGMQVVQPDVGDMVADIVPVDYLARIIIGCAAFVQSPGLKFVLPYNEILEDPHATQSLNVPNILYAPYIYQVSASSVKTVTWREAYESVRHYWTRNTKVTLPPASEHFVSNKTLFKARIFMKYHLPQSLASVTTAISGNNTNFNRSEANPANRTVELASRIVEAHQPFLRHRWVFDHHNVKTVQGLLAEDPAFCLAQYEDLDWTSYMMDYSFGVHTYITQGPTGLRNITLPPSWDCAMYSKDVVVRNLIIDRQIESVIFSASDIQKRTERMLIQIIASLEKPSHQEQKDRKKSEEWVNDFDASLDDWCHDDSELLKDGARTAALGRWSARVGENDEAIKVTVLNDSRVGRSIRQIIETSGVPQQTVVGEAFKILQRMKERTQLAYVWFAGAFLDALFKRLFTSVRLKQEDIQKLKEQIQGKNVVYVPVSKTILDPLLTWYICLRYHLPVPAIVCDEALALLGPISDILRITGAYFVRRDQATRSPLNTAVAAAYTEALLHDHGALSLLIEKARSRTGRLQAVYRDGMVDMVLEATTERNQATDGSVSAKDTVFVPLNITYEKIPELRSLVDQVLDQKPRTPNAHLTTPSNLSRPSASVADRAAQKDNGTTEQGRYGRVYVGIGDIIDIKSKVKELEASYETTSTVSKQDYVVDHLTKTIQKNQHMASIVSPVALVAATVLFSRATNGLSMGAVQEYVEWLRDELFSKGISLDWQEDEDVDSIISFAFNIMDARTNIVIDGKRITEHTNVRVVEHADNVMDLSYIANQLLEIFLPESLFSIVYLSGGAKTVSREELYDRFTFLVRLFKDEFIYPWDKDAKFEQLMSWFMAKGYLIQDDTGYRKAVSMEDNHVAYTRICLLGSFLYPTLDAYWITSCSLSALRDLQYMPRKIVPVLSQWIAAHLISGRRTIYREVLSTEASRNAVNNFLAIGFIDAVHPKSKLSPDAQILLLELGVTTNEDLVMVSNRCDDEEDVSKQKDEDKDNEEEEPDMLDELNDIASLCHEIEKYRFGSDSLLGNQRQNAQVFDKCQNQIRSILRAEKSYATQHGMKLARDEDQMIQLVYSIKAASNAVITSEGSARNPRRVSEAYNLRS
ncbi:cyclin-dependent kinase inhibitor far1 [Apophysomyces sp. BC1034]|nr:cyclin-dependent kinase inhibitor far1 [Apophysomyces sp. BC1015]KAG0178558.1 cyclin-dependent kinase inhibitor far1 [Apophysomyces sp. BC1021]KAG0188788.1 cyclin-dependent kinase inhibitor far1 [Apophysomyces sp. BC1034]